MDLKIDQRHKVDINTYGRKEVERVKGAIEDAEKRLHEYRSFKIITPQRRAKVAELTGAIAVGKMYLKKLKEKWGF